MTFDLHIIIPSGSPAADVVQQVAAVEHSTPEEAVTPIWNEAARLRQKNTPAEELVGAFSNPTDRAIFDTAIDSAKSHRAQFDQVKDFGF